MNIPKSPIHLSKGLVWQLAAIADEERISLSQLVELICFSWMLSHRYPDQSSPDDIVRMNQEIDAAANRIIHLQ